MTALTIDVDDRLIGALRDAAARRRTTVDAAVGECLREMADRAEQEERTGIAEARGGLLALMENSTGRLGPDYRWNREEVYADRMFPRHQRDDLRGPGETG